MHPEEPASPAATSKALDLEEGQSSSHEKVAGDGHERLRARPPLPALLQGSRFTVTDGGHTGYPEISLPHHGGEGEEYCDHTHHSNRAPWLRALVLGANDGLVSVAALLMGVGSGSSDLHFLRLSGVAATLSGALSMAVGEYVSVSSQRDAERADIEKEIEEQLKGPEAQQRELDELAQIYVARGVPEDLARQVAVALTEKDVIRAHARDELGIDIDELANPLLASSISALCFSFGAGLPLLSAVFIADQTMRLVAIALSTTLGLVVFGILGAHLGGAGIWRGGLRVLIGGWIALGLSYGVGQVFNVDV